MSDHNPHYNQDQFFSLYSSGCKAYLNEINQFTVTKLFPQPLNFMNLPPCALVSIHFVNLRITELCKNNMQYVKMVIFGLIYFCYLFSHENCENKLVYSNFVLEGDA